MAISPICAIDRWISSGCGVAIDGRSRSTGSGAYRHQPPFLLPLLMASACAGHGEQLPHSGIIHHRRQIADAGERYQYHLAAETGRPSIPWRRTPLAQAIASRRTRCAGQVLHMPSESLLARIMISVSENLDWRLKFLGTGCRGHLHRASCCRDNGRRHVDRPPHLHFSSASRLRSPGAEAPPAHALEIEHALARTCPSSGVDAVAFGLLANAIWPAVFRLAHADAGAGKPPIIVRHASGAPADQTGLLSQLAIDTSMWPCLQQQVTVDNVLFKSDAP